jgi:hypothetical protein
MDRLQIMTMNIFVSTLDIGKNPEPAAIFDPLIQGFNVWAIPSDHPGGDWERIIEHFDAGAYTKRSAYVGCVFYYPDEHGGYLSVSSDAYKLRDHSPKEYSQAPAHYINGKKSIHNRPDDIAWIITKTKWVFKQIGIPMPRIRIGNE